MPTKNLGSRQISQGALLVKVCHKTPGGGRAVAVATTTGQRGAVDDRRGPAPPAHGGVELLGQLLHLAPAVRELGGPLAHGRRRAGRRPLPRGRLGLFFV